MIVHKFLAILIFLSCIAAPTYGQIKLGTSSSEIDYANPRTYEVGGIRVVGTENLDESAIRILSGLSIGEKIQVPGDKIAKAIKNLWKQKLFSYVNVSYGRIQGNTIFLVIEVKERPRLSVYSFNGVSKSEADDLREKIDLFKEKIVTENLVITTKNIVRAHFVDKGFLKAQVDVVQQNDSIFANHVRLTINVKKNDKIKINKINIIGNEALKDPVIKRTLKETKERTYFKPFKDADSLFVQNTKNLFNGNAKEVYPGTKEFFRERVKVKLFKTSKYIESNFEADKNLVIQKYNQKGYRDAKIIRDSIYYVDDKSINVDLVINEGNKYYFRDIKWIGNSKYPTELLTNILGIKRGDVYNQGLLDTRLFMNPAGGDVSSLYMDNGYLFFQVEPVEVLVENDSIDLEIRIYEGKQARINKVTVIGNTKTNDHVILREIRTKPGELFSRADIIRSQRELIVLGLFDPEQMNVTPTPNPVDGTVDIEYEVAEKPSDQIELSGGWGGNRVVGTLGVSFTNFSMRNLFKPGEWGGPLPAGDGQRLSIRAQTNGRFFQSYNLSFTEPWLGGKKPNSFSVTTYYSIQSNGEKRRVTNEEGDKVSNPDRQAIETLGVTLGLGKRLKIPDDYFQLYLQASYENYKLDRWTSFIFSDGFANNLYGTINVTRSSRDDNIFPTKGSDYKFSLQFTPPYSLFEKKDYNAISDQEKYRWIEYHKWKFTSEWFNSLTHGKHKLVLYTKAGFGFLGQYNRSLGAAPFERFYLGGSGLTGFQFDGREIIALRGYDDQSVSPLTGATLINKYTMELRFPFSTNPSATIYGLTFVEAGNSWDNFSEYNPFAVKRSAGVGIRIFLPMFSLLGLDWGYRLDDVQGIDMQRSQIHFTIGFNLGEL